MVYQLLPNLVAWRVTVNSIILAHGRTQASELHFRFNKLRPAELNRSTSRIRRNTQPTHHGAQRALTSELRQGPGLQTAGNSCWASGEDALFFANHVHATPSSS
jgi:hypothetical protein